MVFSPEGAPIEVRVKARSPVAWIAEVRETKSLKPIYRVTLGVMSKLPGCNKSKRIGGLESVNPTFDKFTYGSLFLQ